MLWSVIAVRADEPEILYLQNGDRFTGASHGLINGSLRWTTQFGQELLIPLDSIERLDVPVPPAVEAGGAAIVAAPPDADSDLAVPLFSDDDESADWTQYVPLYSQASALCDAAADTAAAWTKRIQLGGQFNDGNTTNDLLDFLAEVENSNERSLRQFDGGGQFGISKRVTSVNRRWLNGNIDHTLDGRWITFATTKNEYDQFANLDYRGTLSAGIGYRFLNEDKKRLIGRMGPAVTWELFQNAPFHRTTPDVFTEVEARWPLFGRAQFEHKTRVNPSLANFRLVRMLSTSSILIDLDNSDRWKLRLSFRFEYNSQPAAGRVTSDYLTTVSLVYVRK